MTAHSRRTFFQAGAVALGAVALASVPRPLFATLGTHPEPIPPIDDPRLRELALRGVDAARGAGATYADVRLTHTRRRSISVIGIGDDAEWMTVGVRALFDGYWGFASGPVWSPDELARLGREAVHQAKSNSLGKSRVVELAPVPAVKDGHWIMPVKRDPFEVSPFEIEDFLKGLRMHVARRLKKGAPSASGRLALIANFQLQAKAFASTAGSYCTQRAYRSSAISRIQYSDKGRAKEGELDCLTPAGLGWELFTDARVPYVRDRPLQEIIEEEIEEIKKDMLLPVKPVDVGRYDAVFNAPGVAAIVGRTLGRATELDRALGYEANAEGTSYLSAPFDMLGSYQAGAPLLTLTANRSEPGGVATVQWDDEGVVPDEFTLVKGGVLTDFQTTRESAAWLKAYYGKIGRPIRSHGCANAPEAVDAPLQHTPNLALASGREALDFDALVAGLSKGIACKGVALSMDFQHATGQGRAATTYEVKKGKRVAIIVGAGFLFRATELWKGLLALGGNDSVRRYGMGAQKGEPAQWCYHSVSVPPAIFKELTLIDPLRKT